MNGGETEEEWTGARLTAVFSVLAVWSVSSLRHSDWWTAWGQTAVPHKIAKFLRDGIYNDREASRRISGYIIVHLRDKDLGWNVSFNYRRGPGSLKINVQYITGDSTMNYIIDTHSPK